MRIRQNGKCSFVFLVWSGVCAANEKDVCHLPADSGPGNSNCPGQNGTSTLKFYYSTQILRCIPFPYSGCGGNQNNFNTLEECNAKCGHLGNLV